jgi:hypothetical protein
MVSASLAPSMPLTAAAAEVKTVFREEGVGVRLRLSGEITRADVKGVETLIGAVRKKSETVIFELAM